MEPSQMEEETIKEYINQLTPKEYKAYLIAKDHLQDSFQIEKSNGYLNWIKNKKNKSTI